MPGVVSALSYLGSELASVLIDNADDVTTSDAKYWKSVGHATNQQAALDTRSFTAGTSSVAARLKLGAATPSPTALYANVAAGISTSSRKRVAFDVRWDFAGGLTVPDLGQYFVLALSTAVDLGAKAFTAGSRDVSGTVTLTGLASGHGFIVGQTVTVGAVDSTYQGTVVLTAATTTTVSYSQPTLTTDAASGAGWVTNPAVVRTTTIPPGVPTGGTNYVTLHADIGAFTSIKSFGILRTATDSLDVDATAKIWVDNVRLEAVTGLDLALAAANTVIVPAAYSSAVTQGRLNPSSTKTVMDLRAGRAYTSRADGFRSPREWGILEDESRDVSGDLAIAMNAIAAGETMQAPAGVKYVLNDPILLLNRFNNTFDFNGSTVYSTTNGHHRPGETIRAYYFGLFNCLNTKFQNGNVFGYNAETIWGTHLDPGYRTAAPGTYQAWDSGISVTANLLSREAATGYKESTSAYLASAMWTAGTGTTLGNGTNESTFGGYVPLMIRPTASTATDISAILTTAVTVVAGTTYTAAGYFQANPIVAAQVEARTVRTDIKWYSDSGATTLISTSTGVTAVDSSATGNYVQSVCTAAAPGSAIRAKIVYTVLAADSTSEQHYIVGRSIQAAI